MHTAIQRYTSTTGLVKVYQTLYSYVFLWVFADKNSSHLITYMILASCFIKLLTWTVMTTFL